MTPCIKGYYEAGYSFISVFLCQEKQSNRWMVEEVFPIHTALHCCVCIKAIELANFVLFVFQSGCLAPMQRWFTINYGQCPSNQSRRCPEMPFLTYNNTQQEIVNIRRVLRAFSVQEVVQKVCCF